MEKISILHKEKDFLVIDKPAGIIVHRGETHASEDTVSDLLSAYIDSDAGDPSRKGIVHRLDKDTSGLLIIARTFNGYNHFVTQFKERKVKKHYLAMVNGVLRHKEGIIDSPIGRDIKNRKKMSLKADNEGRNAVTKYKVIEEFNPEPKILFSLLEVEIMTGRTHQIRVHMKAIGHPVVMDRSYGQRSFNNRVEEKFGLNRQFLHAEKLEFIDTKNKKVSMKCPLPDDLNKFIRKIR